MMENMLLLLIIAVFVSAPIVYLIGSSIGKQVSWITFGVLLVITSYSIHYTKLYERISVTT